MTPGMRSVVAGLTARWNQQELITNNISGANSVGHKRQVAAFGTFDQELKGAQSDSLSYAMPPSFDMVDGAIQKTGSTMDGAISGHGFFTIQTASGEKLTRNGHFQRNKDNMLTDASGHLVLGENGPIKLPTGKVELTSTGAVEVKGKVVDRLKIVDVPTSQLQSDGGSIFSVAPGIKPQPLKNVSVTAGVLEGSNVNLPHEMTAMIQNQRMYDMLTKVFQAQDDNQQRAIQDLSAM